MAKYSSGPGGLCNMGRRRVRIDAEHGITLSPIGAPFNFCNRLLAGRYFGCGADTDLVSATNSKAESDIYLDESRLDDCRSMGSSVHNRMAAIG